MVGAAYVSLPRLRRVSLAEPMRPELCRALLIPLKGLIGPNRAPGNLPEISGNFLKFPGYLELSRNLLEMLI